MIGFERSDDYQPLFWVGGRPVHVTPLLVFLHIAALLVCSMLQGLPVQTLALSSEAVFRHWALWQPLTYAFDHILIDLEDTISFILEMVLLFQWGREVERYFGRKIFITLYLAMLFTAPVVLLTYSAVSHYPIVNFHRSGLLHFGVFVAFATIYPSVQFFWGIASKWVAVAVAVLLSAAFFSKADYGQLMVLWSTVAVAYFGVRYASVGSDAFAFFGHLRERFPRKTTPRGVRPRLMPRRAIDSSEPPEPVGAISNYRPAGDVHDSIDPLLDKISKHGLASLTHSERATLERARVSLLRKDRGADFR